MLARVMLASQEDRWLREVVVINLLLNFLLQLSLDKALAALHGVVSHFCHDYWLSGIERDQINITTFECLADAGERD